MNIFILVEHTFNSDHNAFAPKNIGFSNNEKFLNDLISEKQKELIENTKKYNKFMDNQLPHWEIDHPEPKIKDFVKIEIPKWHAVPGQKQIITDDMRKGRQRIEEKNMQAKKEAYKEYSAWVKMRELFISENCPAYNDPETFWTVESLEELKP